MILEKYKLSEFPRLRKNAEPVFERVPALRLNKKVAVGNAAAVETEDEEMFLIPRRPPDPKLEFPGNPMFEDAGFFVRSGIALYTIIDRGTKIIKKDEWPGGFTATQIDPFDEMDWHFECAGVLDAHGWLERTGDLKSEIIAHVAELVGDSAIDDAKENFGENWTTYIGEIAAKHFTEPLSRLWYAANMMSLYYARHEDILFGYLWCEYRVKMRHELFALKHMELTEKNRENGQKGGQADKKAERYAVLDHLARQRFKDIAFASDREGARLAKRLAVEYDAKVETPLFTINNKNLSTKWYGEWLTQFRQTARGIE